MFYTEEQIHEALTVFDETGSVIKTVVRLEYPTQQTLYHWIAERNSPIKEKPDTRDLNALDHPRHPPLEVKLDAIKRCFEDGEDVKNRWQKTSAAAVRVYTDGEENTYRKAR